MSAAAPAAARLPEAPATPPRSPRAVAAAVAAAAVALALHAAASRWSSRQECEVYDEPAHVGAGYLQARLGDHRATPVAAPALTRLAGWRVADIEPGRLDAAALAEGDGWRVGWSVLGAGPGREPLDRARAPFVVLSLLLGAAVFAWGLELWGPLGGAAAAALHAASPEMLAHSHYATLDLGMALVATLALWGMHRFLRRPTLAHGAWTAAALGLAPAVKYSAPALGLMTLAMAAAALALALRDRRRDAGLLPAGAAWTAGPGDAARLTVRLVLVVEAAALVTVVVAWAGFGFRAAASPPGVAAPLWLERLLPAGSGVRAALESLLHRGVIPDGFADGIAATAFAPRNHQMAYFAGSVSEGAFALYFPAVLVLKTPLALLALLALAPVVLRARADRRALVLLAAAAAAYVAVAMAFRVNVGYRHLLPVLPLAFVAGGGCLARLAAAARSRRGRRPGQMAAAAGVVVLGLAGYAAEAVAVAPHFLSSFNRLAGGPDGASRWVVDSNVDWGQDLEELARVLRREGLHGVKLSYFGNGDPDRAGVPYAAALPCVTCCWAPRAPGGWSAAIEPGDVLAVSVTNLKGVYFLLPGRDPLPVRLALPGEEPRTLPVAEALRAVEERLVPIARAGHSILVFRVDAAHLRASPVPGALRPGRVGG